MSATCKGIFWKLKKYNLPRRLWHLLQALSSLRCAPHTPITQPNRQHFTTCICCSFLCVCVCGYGCSCCCRFWCGVFVYVLCRVCLRSICRARRPVCGRIRDCPCSPCSPRDSDLCGSHIFVVWTRNAARAPFFLVCVVVAAQTYMQRLTKNTQTQTCDARDVLCKNCRTLFPRAHERREQ